MGPATRGRPGPGPLPAWPGRPTPRAAGESGTESLGQAGSADITGGRVQGPGQVPTLWNVAQVTPTSDPAVAAIPT